MKISFIAENDWANVLTEYSYCLNKHGGDIESKSICFRPHPFNYGIQHDYDLEKCNIGQRLEAKNWIEGSDVVIFGEENHPLEPNYKTLKEFQNLLGIDLLNSNKKLCIWHPGTHYRKNFNFYNNHPHRDKIYKHFYAIDLYRLSPKTYKDWPLHTYQYYEFNYNKYINNFKKKLNSKPWTVLHIPSNSNIKGTSFINESILKLNLDSSLFKYKALNNIPHSEVIQEKNNSIFYIDQVNMMGGYGVAAIESLFQSNLVFCSTHSVADAILKLTGKYELPIINLGLNSEDISSTLSYYLNFPEDELLLLIKGIGKWVEHQYNPSNIISTFKKILNE